MSRRLKTIAAEIQREFPDLNVTIKRGFCNTDRELPGCRYVHPGKGRYGNELFVRQNGVIIFRHNAAETYRYNEEVERWFVDYRESRKRLASHPAGKE